MELSFIAVNNNCCVINNWCVTISVEASEEAEEAEEQRINQPTIKLPK